MKLAEKLKLLSLEEKVSLTSGQDYWHLKSIPRLDIPSIMVTDGPHGLRKLKAGHDEMDVSESIPSTCFPTAAALASTWNTDLIFRIGEAIAEESLEEQVSVVLGPGLNIKRSPLCGRNFEYFSEDPYLSGKMAAAFVNGVQSKGIGTSLKHFAVNNQEYLRMTIDAVVDPRALHEIYLAGFEIAVKESNPWTVMSAYNRVNNYYCSEHHELLNEILRNKWGFQGAVISDWNAVDDRIESLKAGLDIEMPGLLNGNDRRLLEAVINEQVDESVLDQSVLRILEIIDKGKQTLQPGFKYDREIHHNLAREAAAEGAVLLKNENNILPLTIDSRIGLIGAFAKQPRYQGAGSSLINPNQLDTLYDELVKLMGEDNISYAKGFDLESDQPDKKLMEEAEITAKLFDTVIVCLGLPAQYEVESIDRSNIGLPKNQIKLIEAVSKVNPKVIVVLSNGSPLEMQWIESVEAVLEGYLGGEAGAGAIADLLLGIKNPSGKLAETFPYKVSDTPSWLYFPGGPKTVEYRESLYVGYRYYDSVEKDVLFPFGFGLSYTTFQYTGLQVSKKHINENESLVISFNIKNTGKIAGQEIAQLYVKDTESTYFRPEKELKAFAKISLKPDEEKTISMELDRRAFTFFNPETNDWCVETGDFEILIGASSRDIRLSEILSVKSTNDSLELSRSLSLEPYYQYSPDTRITADTFEALMKRPLPLNEYNTAEAFDTNTPLQEMKSKPMGRFLNWISEKIINQQTKNINDPTSLLMYKRTSLEAPVRLFTQAAKGISYDFVLSLVDLLNGKFFTGLRGILRELFRKKSF